MHTERPEIRQQKRLGMKMIIATWAVIFILLGFLFKAILDNQFNPNQNIHTYTSIDGIKELQLTRNSYGHYVASGSINHHSVIFILDTGATDVAIPDKLASNLGLKKGHPMTYRTANGEITVYATQLREISLGEITLQNVRATINPHYSSDEILLGMSFLKHLEFTQRGDTLTLRQYPNSRND